ncbi:hypothetical protein RFI_06430 [Reticulomyxa filosa]|uniref:FYVE-type domain-containing protein n=1 Tax=Reticulomyxa filosa TaxID=46433 RepID=X6NXF9_RETFI|nr:hypothetical protein RFI_06430 [Reticulomyxa filosa]|eukprot:ETO30691.1 hypothetical protein RFI_06430 [Reticulomyxa filosa]
MFVFNDMMLFASGKPGKYKIHRILYLALCSLEDLLDCRNYQHAFRISCSQKPFIVSFPSAYIKRICFQKIAAAILSHQSAVAQLIAEMRADNDPDLIKEAERFLPFKRVFIERFGVNQKKKNLYNDHCKLCCKQFQTLIKRRRTCPVCNDTNICRDCFNGKVNIDGSSKTVCDGCVDIASGKICVEDWCLIYNSQFL